jgi:putative transposase
MAKVKKDIWEIRRDGKGKIQLDAAKQLSHFFNSYAQTINHRFNRHGKLFEEPFRRKLISNDAYFTSLIYYIHFNPQQHQFVRDFREWEFTSYHSFFGDRDDFIEKSKVINWFGSLDDLSNAHMANMPISDISHLIIE